MPAAVAASRDKLRSRAFMLSYPRDSLLILTLTLFFVAVSISSSAASTEQVLGEDWPVFLAFSFSFSSDY